MMIRVLFRNGLTLKTYSVNDDDTSIDYISVDEMEKYLKVIKN